MGQSVSVPSDGPGRRGADQLQAGSPLNGNSPPSDASCTSSSVAPPDSGSLSRTSRLKRRLSSHIENLRGSRNSSVSVDLPHRNDDSSIESNDSTAPPLTRRPRLDASRPSFRDMTFEEATAEQISTPSTTPRQDSMFRTFRSALTGVRRSVSFRSMPSSSPSSVGLSSLRSSLSPNQNNISASIARSVASNDRSSPDSSRTGSSASRTTATRPPSSSQRTTQSPFRMPDILRRARSSQNSIASRLNSARSDNSSRAYDQPATWINDDASASAATAAAPLGLSSDPPLNDSVANIRNLLSSISSSQFNRPNTGPVQATILSRLLSIAAAATAASLIGDSGNSIFTAARESLLRSLQSENEGSSSVSEDGDEDQGDLQTFEGFLEQLQSGRLMEDLRRGVERSFAAHQERSSRGSLDSGDAQARTPNPFSSLMNSLTETTPERPGSAANDTADREDGDGTTTNTNQVNATDPEAIPLSLFRMFRLARRSELQGGANADRMIPVIIIGVRSTDSSVNVDHEELSASTATDTVQLTRTSDDNDNDDDSDSDYAPSSSNSLFRHDSEDGESTDSENEEESLSESENTHMHDHGVSNDSINGNVQGQRSWIIYVLGGSYPESHPLLSMPSLLTDNPTYEDMVTLANFIGSTKPDVAGEADISAAGGEYRVRLVDADDLSYERMIETTEEGVEYMTIDKGRRCLVCLSEFEEDELLRKLTGCAHYFHRDCIDTWLTTGRNSCPLCRERGVETVAH
ncbi:hypothetical protein CANCADRAFT_146458 [Tortispora caseinolytica NRRL Y-17796]|uniref:RING-type domain-containing protein n=1 Tax=Tortispora caseinolytica NRRL Y-17796 TaxID=767744 RepID=A0A1E4T9K2_9ASCO|nr:hypothetical protein CANCADRAFT_146458 [Tortispora caseinolytica NRRL Y-17796]